MPFRQLNTNECLPYDTMRDNFLFCKNHEINKKIIALKQYDQIKNRGVSFNRSSGVS